MRASTLVLRIAPAASAAVLAMALASPAGAAPLRFRSAFVDSQLAGGEPTVMADPVHHTVVYTAHEGTTHLYRNGLVAPLDFGANYRNQVNIWYSIDNGKSWLRDDLATFQGTTPDKSLGFSDPDLTMDEGGRMYDTGIDLANDALFSSIDGGKTWDKGTAQCHDGDRPWLAGGPKNTAWLATDAEEDNAGSHSVYKSTDGGNSCSLTGVPDHGSTPDGGSYSGFGKLYYDHHNKLLVEPALFSDKDGNQNAVGVSVSNQAKTAFTPHKAAATPGGTFAHWPAIAIDPNNNIYLVWDTNERQADKGGCDGNGTPKPNFIKMAVSRDFGKTWSKPITLGHAPGSRVFWPWIAAGAPGRVSVVWYQTAPIANLNRAPDPDCQNVTVSVFDANVTNATSSSPSVTRVNVVGRPVHKNSTVCQGGTTCVATGQDRRLGDYLTNNLDANGCVMVATGDTTIPDELTGAPRPTALPLFAHQTSGPSLTTGLPCPAA